MNARQEVQGPPFYTQFQQWLFAEELDEVKERFKNLRTSESEVTERERGNPPHEERGEGISQG